MMRGLVAPLSACLALAELGCVLNDPVPAKVAASASAPNLEAARELDHEGVRAFAAGRYRDAILYFREARRLGGPPAEMWNEARCHERLDEGEQAARVIEDYLGQTGLGADEKGEATRELAALRARDSTITIATTPSGAIVAIDKSTAGVTPLSAEITPGPHTLTVKRDGYVPQTHKVDARFGRAILLEIDLEKK